MNPKFKYLHSPALGTYYLDNRLVPEVRAMFCAMASRMPAGGIKQRYAEVVETVRDGLDEEAREAGIMKLVGTPLDVAEDRLCEYPLHPRVQEFFDKFVAAYGHSSILELTGMPAVFVEGVSWWTAYKLFDNPLCAGQEFSTRAVRHKDWPMARETMPSDEEQYRLATVPGLQYPLARLHERWLTLFEHEVEAWQERLKNPEVRKELGIADKEPFRPALDRARWTIPGTIATGCSQTANLRVMARTVKDGLSAASSETPREVWEGIRQAYREALPGLADMGLREAHHDGDRQRPGHLEPLILDPDSDPSSDGNDDCEVWAAVTEVSHPDPMAYTRKAGSKTYVDPSFNNAGRVDVSIPCSIAVARDWHRHRTFYPWRMYLLRPEGGTFMIHDLYEPVSEYGEEHLPGLLGDSTTLFDEFMAAGDVDRAMLCLPLGTKTLMMACAGLRDALYTFELRAYAHGANFEYRGQALSALRQIREQIAYRDLSIPADVPPWGPKLGFPDPPDPDEGGVE